jgi:hypothetical protein
LRENVLKIVLNEVKGQRTNIRTVYKIKLNRRTETRKHNSQFLLLPSHKEAKNLLKKYREADSKPFTVGKRSLQRLDEKNSKI